MVVMKNLIWPTLSNKVLTNLQAVFKNVHLEMFKVESVTGNIL